MKKLTLILLITCLFISVFSGCEKTENSSERKRIIAVSIVPEAAFAEKICGDEFQIITMIPPGASPETYEPTAKQMQSLEKAEIYFAIGVPAEEAILENISPDTKVIKLHEIVKETYPELCEDGGRDPHIWLSPKRAQIMVSAMADAIGISDKSNSESYIKELENLDNEIRFLIGENGGKFMVFHPAFAYFADDYGLTMYALEEHGKEATAKRIAEMADLAKKENIKVIFYQAESSSRQAEAFAEEIGGKAVSLEPLAYDYTENLRTMAKSILAAMK